MTPRFQFPLDTVLHVREHAKDLAQEELASGLAHMLRGEALLQEAALVARRARAAAHDSLAAGATTAADLQAAQMWAERAERNRLEAALEVDRRDAEVRSRRVVLDQAARDHAVVDRLRDRRLEAHKVEAQRLEQGQLDEIALQRHGRGRAA